MLIPTQLASQIGAFVAVLAVAAVFVYLGTKHLVRLLAAARRGKAATLWRRERRPLTFIFVTNLVFVLCFAYGWLWEADWVERVDLVLEAEIPEPLRIVHLSDLHLEGFGGREQRALEIVRSATPDLIFLTGDYTSRETGLTYAEDLTRFFAELEAPSGIFAVLGNWDLDTLGLFEDSNVNLLTGEPARVRVGDTEIFIVGTVFETPPPPADGSAGLTIYLQHSPDLLAEASDAGYDLYLAGHTHGGQVRIPGYGAVITLSRYGKRYEAGLFSQGGTYLYVNRGLGLEGGWMPRVRLFCRPEVTVIDLVPEVEDE